MISPWPWPTSWSRKERNQSDGPAMWARRKSSIGERRNCMSRQCYGADSGADSEQGEVG